MTTQLAFEDETKRSRGFRGCWLGVDISGAGIAAMVLGAISMAFDAAALGTRHWAYGKVTPDRLREVNMGLFEYCEGNRCSMYFDNEFPPSGQRNLNLSTRTQATAAFLIIALMLTFLAMVFVVFGLGRTGFSIAISRASSLMIIAGLSCLLSVIIFGALINELPDRFSAEYSIALAIVSFFFNFISAGLLIIDSRNLTYHHVGDAVRKGGAGMI